MFIYARFYMSEGGGKGPGSGGYYLSDITSSELR